MPYCTRPTLAEPRCAISPNFILASLGASTYRNRALQLLIRGASLDGFLDILTSMLTFRHSPCSQWILLNPLFNAQLLCEGSLRFSPLWISCFPQP
jgi:hypothetical protein